MTQMQLNYQKLQEDKRHNAASEQNQRYSADQSYKSSVYGADQRLAGSKIKAEASRYATDTNKQIADDRLAHEKKKWKDENVYRAIEAGTRVAGTLGSIIAPF